MTAKQFFKICLDVKKRTDIFLNVCKFKGIFFPQILTLNVRYNFHFRNSLKRKKMFFFYEK